MERECQEECVLIHFDLLRETIDRYLKKHSFCDECTKMVNKAYTLLVTDDEESECCDSTAPKCCGHETPNQNQSSQCKGMYTVYELYYCTIILRDALKLQMPRDKFFIPRGEAPRDEKCPEGFAISMHPEK